MFSYNIYFDINEDWDEAVVMRLAREFCESLQARGCVESSLFSRTTNKGNFLDMPDFHVAVNFQSEESMMSTFTLVRESLLNEYPHSDLMKSVKNMKVAFTQLTG